MGACVCACVLCGVGSEEALLGLVVVVCFRGVRVRWLVALLPIPLSTCVLQCVAVCCSVLQCVAVCCSEWCVFEG